MIGALLPRGRPRLYLVPRRPAPRIEARISIADGRSPIGRSRLFRLLDELISHAERLEARAGIEIGGEA
jgi:hypothetical protein